MSIKVLYFASLKEQFGCSEEQLNVGNLSTVGEVWQQVSAEQNVPQHVLFAVNQEYAQLDTLIKSGDEVAFFPPVTGG